MATRATSTTTDTEPTQPRVVLAHDFLEAFGGAERVLGAMATAFPAAPVWTILARPSVAQRAGVQDDVTSLLPPRRGLLRHYRALAPLYPAMVRARKLPAADVLLTSSYAFAHGFETANRAPQVCYCHSPLRFAWSMTDEYGRRYGGRFGALALRALAAGFRAADFAAASKVHTYLANSRHVATQLHRFYGVTAEVVPPPVDCDRFRPTADDRHDGYFLFCGRLVEPYKRPMLAVEAFRGLSKELVVAGDGPAASRLRRAAPSNVRFVGALDDEELIPLMQRAAALVFPSRDDFGLLPVEMMACGRPVIAFAAGGALESVVPNRTGTLFGLQTVEALRTAIRDFDPNSFDSAEIRTHALQWQTENFVARIRSSVEAAAI